MNGPLRILWLKTGPLHPVDTGGKIRTYNMLRVLKQHSQTTYLALRPPGMEEATARAGEYSREQIWIPWQETRKMSAAFFRELARNQFLSGLPYIIQKYQSSGMIDAIRTADNSGGYDLIVCDFLTPAVNLFAGGWRAKTPTLLFEHNVESLIWQRMCDNAANPVKKAYFRGQWKRLEKFERSACSQADSVVAVSDEDARLLRTQYGLKNILGSVPTGVDVEYFRPSDAKRKTCSIAFLGSMDWMPNIDAIAFFMEEIYPLLASKHAGVTFTIVGRNPPKIIQELANRHPGVRVTGTVPDVRPHLAEAEVMIVPLRVGGGTRIKIFEAMATGIPVVSTTIGAEGLPVKDGDHILLADSPADFARKIGDLFVQPDLRRRIGQSALNLVREEYSWNSVIKVFEEYCLRTAAGQGGGV
jgi:glycosyltransferase involved in cell wall biosynthesis